MEKDKIIEFFTTTVKERFRRPFSSAFFISWFISNWKLWVILLKYDAKSFDILGEIKKNFNFCHQLFYPFIGAIAFILGIGWLNLIVEKIRKRYFIEKQKLNEYEEEKKTENEKIKLNNKYNSEWEILNNPFNVGLLNGKWELIITRKNAESPIAIIIMEFSGGNVYMDTKQSNTDKLDWQIKEVNHIEHIGYHIQARKVNIVFSVSKDRKIEFLEYLEFTKLDDSQFVVETIVRNDIEYHLRLRRHFIKKDLKNE